MTDQAKLRAGIDIGGTFTDMLLFDEASGTFTIGKTLTTQGEPAIGVMNAIREVGALAGAEPSAISQIVHGTTLVTNALIERKGSPTALITTKGFRDALEIAREHRYDLYDLMIELPEPLAPRHLRFELNERVLSDGSVLQAPDPSEIGRLVEHLQSEGIKAVAVSLIHSYINPEHENLVGAEIARLAPELTVSLSSDVVPEIREYERTSTTVANVYVRPLTETYLEQLVQAFHDAGFAGSVFIMLSSGGLSSVAAAQRYPIRLVESGPAAGALAASHIGKLSGRPQLLSFDMGGTTAKCCLIGKDGLTHSSEFEVGRVYRFKQGSGFPISVPVIELIEIGAGGGSIARIDNLGLLKVGPDSAGADPGPACYGRGGTEPTVTDADLVLGYLDADHFLGGAMKLDVSASRRAIETLGARLDLSVEETAWGIHKIVNEQMASAARIHAIERGEDARLYPMFAFGGAGPVHAFGVAEILRSPEIIVPFGAGVGSTIGFLVAPIAFDFVRTVVGHLDQLDWTEINVKFAEMIKAGNRLVEEAGAAPEAIRWQRFAELRYVGQGHQVRVDLPFEGPLSEEKVPEIVAAFEQTYLRLYGRVAEGNPIEAINWRVIVSAPSPHLPLDGFGPKSRSSVVALRGERKVFQPAEVAYRKVPVFDRYAIGPEFRETGPLIIEERESTIIVGPGATVTVDDFFNVVIRMPSQ